MKLDTEDLLRLARILQTKARAAQARADEHAQARELAEHKREVNRAEAGLYFAEVCIAAHAQLTAKRKRSGFVAPSWEETLEYAQARHPQWPVPDVLAWWNHFESNGWKVSGKTPMARWKNAADNGFRNWQLKNPQAAPATPRGNPRTLPDPEGWREFLKSLGRPYKEHRFEQEWVRTEFRTSRKK